MLGNGDDETDDGDDEWRYSLADLEEDEAETVDSEEAENGGNVAGSLAGYGPIETGDIDLENAFFVALGVLFAALVLVGFVLNLT